MTARATMEPEVVEANLRALGCPFAATDDRASTWLEGYRAGLERGFADAEKAMRLAVAGGIS